MSNNETKPMVYWIANRFDGSLSAHDARFNDMSGFSGAVKVIEMAAYEKLSAQLQLAEEVLKRAEKRFSHIENWHRDNVTPDNFEDCQEVGQTPEAYLRDGKLEVRAYFNQKSDSGAK